MIFPSETRLKSRRRRNTSAAARAAFAAAGRRRFRAYAASPTIGRSVSMKDEVSASGWRSQFQPPSGHKPMQQPFSERVRTLVGDAESEQRVQRVALLRRAAAIPAAHERDALTAVRLGFGPCGELVEIARTKPEL